jgi:hypothetical protein
MVGEGPAPGLPGGRPASAVSVSDEASFDA